MIEIYINTLPDIEYKVFINDMTNTPDRVAFDDFAGDKIDLLNLKVNREHRRHGSFGKDGYKRPRSNKKLYEY